MGMSAAYSIWGEAFQGWKSGAIWDDMHFGFKHRNDIAKVAIVGGPRWVEWVTKLRGL